MTEPSAASGILQLRAPPPLQTPLNGKESDRLPGMAQPDLQLQHQNKGIC